jgi:hypothetical protein
MLQPMESPRDSASSLPYIRSHFKRCDTHFDIFDLDCFGRVSYHDVGGAKPCGCRRGRIQHDLQERRDGCAGGLLHAGDGLRERRSARFPVGLVELGFLQPPE